MPRKTWTLTEDSTDTYLERFSAKPEDVGGTAKGYSVTKRTLRGGLSAGVDIIEVDNGQLWFAIIPTRGMGIFSAVWRSDLVYGWPSPVNGPVNPAFVPIWEPSGIGWLSGFDEMLVRCGLESNGSPEFRPDGTLQWPLHGKIANIPAHQVRVTIDGDSGEIAVRGIVDEARLFGSKLRMVSTISTKVDQPWLTVTDEITNLSAEPGELELIYHINFGSPLLAPGASLVMPVKKVAPSNAVAAADIDHWNVYAPETPGKPEVCFFFDPAADASGQTRALLRSADGRQGVSVKFNKQQLPCFTLWKNQQATADGYVTGLEPAINYPNRRSFEKEQGRVATLAPGESRRFKVTVEAHPNPDAVAAAERAVASIQGTITPEICPNPDPDWSAT